MKVKKRLVSVVLSLLLCLQLVPSMPVMATDEAAEVETTIQDEEQTETDVEEAEADTQTDEQEQQIEGEVPDTQLDNQDETGMQSDDQADIEAQTDEQAAGQDIAAQAGTVQITDEGQLEPYFKDALFRAAVFKAVRDGADGAEGADVVEALNNFMGEVKYNKSNATPKDEKIKDIHGIEYLRNATLVSLKYNEISDFSWLEKEKIDDADNERYFGQLRNTSPDLDEDAKNVTWDFGGNPIQKLPAYFGGQLKILQPGGASYTYSEDLSQQLIYVRPVGSTAVSGDMNINEAYIYENGRETGPLGILECYVSSRPGDIATKMTVDSFNDLTAQFSNLEKSGVFHVYVGTKTEFKYGTNDEWGGITPGAQSTKYYITPTFRIYDRITAESINGGNAELIKTDNVTGDPVKGAVYSLYTKDDTLVSENLTTDENGKLVTGGLAPGEYYFKETKAPDGYKPNADKVNFKIEENTTGTLPNTQVDGGETTINTTDGQTITAAANEKLFSGGKDGNGNLLSPDLALSSTKSDEIAQVKVTYSNHETEGADVVRTFNSLAEAEADINAEKGNNTILGPVSVKAYYAQASGTPVQVTTTDESVRRTDIKVDKVWKDTEDFSGTHPDITLRLFNGTTEVANGVLKAPETSYTFKNVPAEDAAGKDISYTVKEDGVTGYTSKVDGLVVTNTFENTEKTALSGTKSWVDYNNALSTRPDKVTIALIADDKEIQTMDIDAGGNWEYTFADLPKYTDAGKKINYTIAEKDVAKDYTEAVDGSNITNTLDKKVNENVTIEGQKVWSDYNNALETRPKTLTVDLYQNDAPYKTQEITKKGDWSYKFTELPKYDVDGKEFVYTVKEDKVPDHYTSEVIQNGTTWQITNTLDKTVNEIAKVEGTKSWSDYNDVYKMRPAEVTVDLYKDDAKISSTVINADNNWSYSFAGLPKFDDAGKEITYTVKEDVVPEGYTVSAEGYNLTNTLDEKYNNTVTIEGLKQWNDYNNALDLRPKKVTVSLLQNGAEVKTVKTDAEKNWSYSFSNLPKYDADGKEFAYTVKEENIPKNYTAEVTQNGTTTQITNTLDQAVNEVVKVEGTKSWSDYNDAYKMRPAEVTVDLYKDDVKIDSKVINEKDKWSYSFTGLAKFDDAGKKLTYTVKEDAVPDGYSVSAKGYNLTNTLDEKYNNTVTIEGTKQWNDHNNALGMRSEKVTVALLQNDVEAKTVETDAEQNWNYSFADLPKYNAEGKEFAYTIKEVNVPEGYTSKVDGTTITNTLDDSYNGTVNVTGKKIWSDDDNAYKTRPDSVTIELYQNTDKKDSKNVKASDKWEYSFKGLAKYDADGKEYTYTVKEVSVPKNYTASVDGYNITNTLDETYKKQLSKDPGKTDPDNKDKKDEKSDDKKGDKDKPSANASNAASTANQSTTKSKTPKTGDETNAGVLVVLALASIGTIVIVAKKRKKI